MNPLQYRVNCTKYATLPGGLAETQAWIDDVEASQRCTEGHGTVVLDGDWLPPHADHARRILAAPVGPARIETPDGLLIKCQGNWSKEAEDRAAALADPGTDRWRAALGAHEGALLTADGRLANWHDWCRCNRRAAQVAWVPYERWSIRGREASGHVCPGCRRCVHPNLGDGFLGSVSPI